MLRNLLFIICIFSVSCTSNRIKDRNVQIVIDIPFSYKYDLNKGIYTVFFDGRPPLEVKFSFTNKEWDKIANSYYELQLNEIKGITEIEDECQIMPKFYTILNITTRNGSQRIKIDDSCDNFYISNWVKAHRINKFINIVFEILKSKKEIKNAPYSNIMYL